MMPRMATTTHTVEFAKIDPEHRMAFGWAYKALHPDGTPVHDSGGIGTPPGTIDLVDTPEAIDAMEHAFYKFAIESRTADDMHQVFGVADLVELVVFTPDKVAKMGLPAGTIPTGAWVGFQFPETKEGEAAWQEVRKGNRPGLSIVGRGQRVLVEP